jgi:DoxX-like family
LADAHGGRLTDDGRVQPATIDPVTRLARPATWLLAAIFTFSGVWTLVDPDGARRVMVVLGFPGYFLYPLAVAKLLGVVALLTRRSLALVDLAFAGFFYDLLLALTAHVRTGEPGAGLAVAGLVVWLVAFLGDRRRNRRTIALG